ncbi:phospholipase C accessory protein PlcR [Burkholderia savannae]|uniref:Phospholipase C accessory protein PlcR n=1 Tax=Burkholderia savannae TaxID=1637837 RepID=A0ABR5TF82_9BURK|nr:phospholipase C accessory protein PlcR [Burkholderia savannae]KWZ43656.1 phospholipase C accessory protein PlcR [Burkholderia savannae]
MKKSKTLWRTVSLLTMIGAAVAVWRYVMPSPAAAAWPAQSGATPSERVEPSAGATPSEMLADAGPAERKLDLVALRKSLAGRADAEAQVQRIVAFARFRDRVAAYGEGRNSMPVAQRARLAHQILAELPEHVARNEIVPVQAEAIGIALVADTTADSATRSAAIQVMRQQWDAYARQTVGPSPAQDPRYQAYAQQSRDIVMQVQASISDPGQQQAVIAQRLQALRVQLFDQSSRPDTR